MKNPAIVIIAYNRPDALARLLHSLNGASYQDADIPLIISMDGGAVPEVVSIASDFAWIYGEKRIVQHDHQLGLREHVMKCGRLTEEYDAVLVLEDDLFVAPHFYSYAKASLSQASKDEKVSGISLFSYHIKEFKHLPFVPIEDGFDNYFLQVPSSWGQIWTKTWWSAFEAWMVNNAPNDIRVPDPVYGWNDQSWKKRFLEYLIDSNLYFFYPRVSLTTNFGDEGTNHKGKFARYQVPLQMGRQSYRFSSYDESQSTYDVFFEWEGLREEKYQQLEFDLYGEKPSYNPETQFVLTTRPVRNAMKSYGASMLPLEANFVHEVPGNEICLAKKEDVLLNKFTLTSAVFERLVGKFSKQRYGKQYFRQLKEDWGW